jgi:hypothetical protein
MITMSLTPDYLGRLIVKLRGVQAREGEVDIDSGSNPNDDRMIDAVQDTRGDLSRAEVRAEIRGLNDRQQAELVALLWTGRGDAEPEEWERTVEMAFDRRDTPTDQYLLHQPLAAEFWSEGAEKLGIEVPVEMVEERR